MATQITELSLGVSPRYTLSSPALEKEVWPLFAKVTESVFIAAVFFPGTGSKYGVVIRYVWWNQLHITSTLCQVFYKLTQKGPLFAWISSKAFDLRAFFSVKARYLRKRIVKNSYFSLISQMLSNLQPLSPLWDQQQPHLVSIDQQLGIFFVPLHCGFTIYVVFISSFLIFFFCADCAR